MTKTSIIKTKLVFFFSVGVVLSALFFWVFIEGLKTQLQSNNFAILLYLLASLSGLSAVYNYLQARTLFKYLKMS